MTPRYKRVLLKLSGEALMGDQGFGISPDMLQYVSEEVRSIVDLGVGVAIVVASATPREIARWYCAAYHNYDLDGDRDVDLSDLAELLALQGKQPDEALQLVQKAITAAGPVPSLLDTRASPGRFKRNGKGGAAGV